MSSDSPAAASSKTYRKVNRKIAEVARVPAQHTEFPSEDFEAMIDLLKEHSKERALRYYGRGTRRGLIAAFDAILDGCVQLKDGALYFNGEQIAIPRTFRFSDGTSERREFKFTPEDLDFE